MTDRKRLTVVLAPDILGPFYLRDLLHWFAHYRLYTPKWTHKIDITYRQILTDKNLPDDYINTVIVDFKYAFKEAEVVLKSEHLAPFTDFHPDQAQSIAVAKKVKADYILSDNIAAFPALTVSQCKVELISPDAFLVTLINANANLVLKAWSELYYDHYEAHIKLKDLIQKYEASGLRQFSAILSAYFA